MTPTILKVEIELQKTERTRDFPCEFFYQAKVTTEPGRDPVVAESRNCPTAYEAFIEMCRLLHDVV